VAANTSSSSKARALQPKGNAASVPEAVTEAAGKTKVGVKAGSKASAPKAVAVVEAVRTAAPVSLEGAAKAQKGKGKKVTEEVAQPEVAPAGPQRSARPMRA
jgi:hypothetical protein